MHKFKYLILAFAIFFFHFGKAEDTLRVTISQADSMFQANSYYLLASSMNIEAQRAQVIQATLYPNPVFTGEINAYDPQNHKAFHDGRSGEKSFQVQQLIVLGGKRKSAIEMAKSNVRIAELEFQDLVRKLRFQLHSSLYALDEQAYLLSMYTRQLNLLDTILTAYEVQERKGNVPLKDVVRLKGVYLNLNNTRTEVYKQFLDELSKVQTLLQTNKIVFPMISDTEIAASVRTQNLDELIQSALQHRPDYLVSLQDKALAEQYYHFTRKQAIPDMSVFSSYDQRGGAFLNQVDVGVSMQLPFWDRNKGNIKSAQYQMKQKEYSLEAMKNEILAEIENVYAQYIQTVKQYEKTNQLFNEDFGVTLKGMSDNFKKGNVSLIEFVDFFEAHNSALAEVARIKIELAVSVEQVNLSAGK